MTSRARCRKPWIIRTAIITRQRAQTSPCQRCFKRQGLYLSLNVTKLTTDLLLRTIAGHTPSEILDRLESKPGNSKFKCAPHAHRPNQNLSALQLAHAFQPESQSKGNHEVRALQSSRRARCLIPNSQSYLGPPVSSHKRLFNYSKKLQCVKISA